MRTLAAVLTLCALTAASGTALAGSQAAAKAPQNLKPFLLRANERAVHEFPRTPSWNWSAVRGAVRYEFQLSKSLGFSDAAIFYRHNSVRYPSIAPPIALPWMTGEPYAAYARVRAVTAKGVTPWSKPYGFNLRWQQQPKKLADYPGLSRWTPVEGATGYQVWFTKIGPGWTKTVSTRTTAVDHREAYFLHDGEDWSREVRWRVRAVRTIFGEIPNGLPAVSYGPWSKEYVTINPQLDGGLRVRAAVTADASSRFGKASSHLLTPAFSFSGREAFNADGLGGSFGLYRVYVATDRDCVNVVFRGAVVGSPAYAPRSSGPLQLPSSGKEFDDALSIVVDDAENEGETFGADNLAIQTNESKPDDAATTTDSGSDSGSDDSGTGSEGSDAPATFTAPVDLVDSGWPQGRYYWTVVPVVIASNDGGQSLRYYDVRLPQDTCQAGNVIQFGKATAPVVTGKGTPFASGLSPKGRMIASRGAKSSFYGSPLVAWLPAQGAATYEVQWSRKAYPWKVAGKLETSGTAASLKLKPGTWYYRIRGLNPYLPGTAKAMTWSLPQKLKVAAPKFSVVRR